MPFPTVRSPRAPLGDPLVPNIEDDLEQDPLDQQPAPDQEPEDQAPADQEPTPRVVLTQRPAAVANPRYVAPLPVPTGPRATTQSAGVDYKALGAGSSRLARTYAPQIKQQMAEETAQAIQEQRQQRADAAAQRQANAQAIKEANSATLAEYQAEGRPHYIDPSTGLVTPKVDDETWQAGKEQRQKNDELRQQYYTLGRPYTIDKKSGGIIAKHTDEEWQAIQDKRHLADEIKGVRAETVDAGAGPRKIFTETQRQKAEKDYRQATRDAVDSALAPALGNVAKTKEGGILGFGQQPTADAKLSLDRLERLNQARADSEANKAPVPLEDADLAELEKINPKLHGKITTLREQLKADDENRAWHETQKQKEADLKLRFYNPEAWKKKHLADVDAVIAPSDAKTQAQQRAADLAPKLEDFNTQARELADAHQTIRQGYDDIAAENEQAIAGGLRPDDATTITRNGQTETWSKTVLAKLEAHHQAALEAEQTLAPARMALEARGRILQQDQDIALAAANRAAALSQEKRAGQLDRLRRTPGLAEHADRLAKLDADGAQFDQELADMPEGPEKEQYKQQAQDYLEVNHQEIRDTIAGKQTAGLELYKSLRTHRPTKAWATADGRAPLRRRPNSEAGPTTDADQDLADIRFFSESLGLSDEEAAHWIKHYEAADFQHGNKQDQTRVLPDGTLAINPGLWTDPTAMRQAIEASPAEPAAKAEALDNIPAMQSAARERDLADFSKGNTKDAVRILGDGSIATNPVLDLDIEKLRPAIENSSATPEAKQTALDALPQLEANAYNNLARGLTMRLPSFSKFVGTHFPEEAAAYAGGQDFKNPKGLVDAYNQQRGAKLHLDKLYLGIMQGAGDITQTAFGLIGAVTGSQGMMERAAATGRDVGQLGQLGDALPGRGTQMLASGAMTLIPAMAGGFAAQGLAMPFIKKAATRAVAAKIATRWGLTGAGGAAGLQTFGSVVSDAYAANIAQGLSHEQALAKSYLPATASGLSTMALTILMPGGTERVFNRAARLGFTRNAKGLLRAAGFFVKEGGKEFMEEAADQWVQGLIARYTYTPGKSFEAITTEAMQAGAVGFVLGGALGTIARPDRSAEQEAAHRQQRQAWADQLNTQMKAVPGFKPVTAGDYDAIHGALTSDEAKAHQQAIADLLNRRTALVDDIKRSTPESKTPPAQNDLADAQTAYDQAVTDHQAAVSTGLDPAEHEAALVAAKDALEKAQLAHQAATDHDALANAASIPGTPAPTAPALKAAVDQAQARVDEEQAKYGTPDFNVQRNADAIRDRDKAQAAYKKAQQADIQALADDLKHTPHREFRRKVEQLKAIDAELKQRNTALEQHVAKASQEAAKIRTTAQRSAGLSPPSKPSAQAQTSTKNQAPGTKQPVTYDRALTKPEAQEAAQIADYLTDRNGIDPAHAKAWAEHQVRQHSTSKDYRLTAIQVKKDMTIAGGGDVRQKPFADRAMKALAADQATLRAKQPSVPSVASVPSKPAQDDEDNLDMTPAPPATKPLPTTAQQSQTTANVASSDLLNHPDWPKRRAEALLALKVRIRDKDGNLTDEIDKAATAKLRKNAQNAIAALDKALAHYGRLFPGGVALSDEADPLHADIHGPEGRSMGVLPNGGQHRLIINPLGFVRDYGKRANTDAIRAVVEEELIHNVASRLFSHKALADFWNRLPTAIRNHVWKGYHAWDIISGDAPPEAPGDLPDGVATNMAHEFIRQLVQDSKFRGRVTESLDVAPGLGAEIVAFLKNLLKNLRDLIKKAPAEIRAQIADYEAKVNAALDDVLKDLPSEDHISNKAASSAPSVSSVTFAGPASQDTHTLSSAKPNGAKVKFRWRVESAALLKPLLQRTINTAQTRQRKGNKNSQEQVQKIRTGADPTLLMDSPTGDTGAPVVDTQAALAGNGRLEGLILGYEDDNPSSKRYRTAILEKAEDLGLADADAIRDPILIREVIEHTAGTREDFVDENNPMDKGLKETPAEGAIRDAKALGDIGGLEWNEDGNLSAESAQEAHRRLLTQQRGITTNAQGRPVITEATKRVQLAALANMAKAGNVDVADFIGLLESPNGKRAVGDVVRAAPALQALDPDLALATDTVAALRELQAGLHARDTKAHDSLEAWHEARKSELLTSDLNEGQERILEMMVLGQKKAGLLRAFFDEYLTYAKREQAERTAARGTPDLLGEQRRDATASALVHRAHEAIRQERGPGQGDTGSPGQDSLTKAVAAPRKDGTLAVIEDRLARIQASGLFTNQVAARHLAESAPIPSARKADWQEEMRRASLIAEQRQAPAPAIKDRPPWGPAAEPADVHSNRKYWLRKDGAAVQVTEHLEAAGRAQQDSDDWDNRKRWGYKEMFSRGWIRLHTEDMTDQANIWADGDLENMSSAQRAWIREARDAWAKKTTKEVHVSTGRGKSFQINLGAPIKDTLDPRQAAKAYEKLFKIQQAGAKLSPSQQLIFERAEKALGQKFLFGLDVAKAPPPAENLVLESQTDTKSWAPQQLTLFATRKDLPDYIKELAKPPGNATLNRENEPAKNEAGDRSGVQQGHRALERSGKEAPGGRPQHALERKPLAEEYRGLDEYDGQALSQGLDRLGKYKGGQEHLVWQDGDLAIKLTLPGKTGARKGVGNYLFQQQYIVAKLGDDSQLLGITYLPGDTEPRLLSVQTWQHGRESTPEEIDSFMRHRKFEEAGKGTQSWYNWNDESYITDAAPRNFITVRHPDGSIAVHPIDVIVSWPTQAVREMIENRVNAQRQTDPIHQLVENGRMRLPGEAAALQRAQETAASVAPPPAKKPWWHIIGSPVKVRDLEAQVRDLRARQERIIGDIRPRSLTDVGAWNDYHDTISRIPELGDIAQELLDLDDQLRVYGHQGLAAGGLMLFAPLKGDSFVEPGFYSKLYRAIEAKLPASATTDQVRGIAKSGDVKPEELKWSGLEQWLDQQPAKVTRADVLHYLEHEGAIRFQEVLAGEAPDLDQIEGLEQEIEDRREQLEQHIDEGNQRDWEDDQAAMDADSEYIQSERQAIDELREEAARLRRQTQARTPKYAKYTLPGGENYREIVLARPANTALTLEQRAALNDLRKAVLAAAEAGGADLPKVKAALDHIIQEPESTDDRPTEEQWLLLNKAVGDKVDLNRIYDIRAGWILKKFTGWGLVDTATGQTITVDTDEGTARAHLVQAAQNQRRPISDFRINPAEWTQQERVETGAYQSGHFGSIPDYLAHMRLTDREGGTLMEELQSDRHQQAREHGYAGSVTQEEVQRLVKEQNIAGDRLTSGPAEGPEAIANRAAYDKAREAATRATRILHGDGIPDAPFRSTWPLQLFKRALRQAVESGKEWLGWTTGATQAERYKLSTAVRTIEWNPVHTIVPSQHVILDTTAGLVRFNTEGGMIVNSTTNSRLANEMELAGKSLASVIGKDLARRIESQHRGKIEGVDLDVGGEGMKGFYDQILPKEIARYVKQWGGMVEKGEVITDPGRPDGLVRMPGDTRPTGRAAVTVPIWRVTITPAMRQGVAGGQPLFATRKADLEPDLFALNYQRNEAQAATIANLLPELPESKLDLWDWAGDTTTSHDVLSRPSLESDRTGTETGNAGGKSSVQTRRPRPRKTRRPLDQGGTQSGHPADRGPLSADVPAALDGGPSNPSLHEQAPELESSPAGNERPGGSGQHHDSGASPDAPGRSDAHADLTGSPTSSGPLAPSSERGSQVGDTAPAGSTKDQGPKNQEPWKSPLTPEQRGDVAFAEQRLLDKGKPGVLITNGTGTGKTFSGLGLVKNMLDRGAQHILVVAPSDKVCNDWKDTAAEFFGIHDAALLQDTKDTGAGNRVVVTTYANLGQNPALVHRPWDLVATDEAHYLSQAQAGDDTLALDAFRALTWHEDGLWTRAEMLNPELVAERAKIQAINYRERSEAQNDRMDAIARILDQTRAGLLDQAAAKGESGRPKALFMSATPFAYHFSLDYAEGYLFDHGPEPTSSAYNTPSARSRFYIENFGYRMRTGKLTQPENATATGILERRFAEKLMREGAMSGRALSVPHDYSRKFILAESALGAKIDDILRTIQENPRFSMLSRHIGLGDYLSRRYLLEGLKARESIARIKQHLALGRKVVVFHDYKKGGARNPLAVTFAQGQSETHYNEDTRRYEEVNLAERFAELKAHIPDYEATQKALGGLVAPIDLFRRAFPDAGIFNGSVPKKQRRKLVTDFNKSGGKMNVMLVQRASGKEGISLHDRDGQHQRVFLDLGIPGRPTDAIQGEGRIYRHGVKSNAIMEYLTTGTAFERWTFAQTIAQRASTAENLAMGERARALLQSFASAYNDAAPETPHAGQGTGGKAQDHAREHGDPYDNAIALFYTNQKKTSRNKSSEGADYFATPEPVGFKMVEWSYAQPGEKMLEPSAGHGAIARFFPDSTTRHAVEPSNELAGRLALNAPDTEIHNHRFEDFNTVNKFDVVDMNPPFGTAGKTAMDHLIKATEHLREGGRVVALIPMGSSMETRFDAWRESDAADNFYLRAEIILPGSTFSRAGTGVFTRIVILDRYDGKQTSGLNQVHYDLSSAEDHKELFERLRDLSVPPRPDVAALDAEQERLDAIEEERRQAELATRRGGATIPTAPPAPTVSRADAIAALMSGRGGRLPSVPSPTPAAPAPAPRPTPRPVETTIPTPAREGTWSPREFRHSKTGATMFAVQIQRRLTTDEFNAARDAAKALGGYYSRYKGQGAVPGFLFKSAEARDLFLGSKDIMPIGSPRKEAPAGSQPGDLVPEARRNQKPRTKNQEPSRSPLDAQAHAAATSPLNDHPNPTPPQKDAGNYKMGHVNVSGLDISVENPAGSVRSGITKEGKPWRTQLQDHYGYIKRTEGKDGDHLDIFIKPGTPADYPGPVYVINQLDPATGKFDEHKAVIGAGNRQEAADLYHRNYQPGWQGFGSMVELPLERFKKWALERKRTAPLTTNQEPRTKNPPRSGRAQPLSERVRLGDNLSAPISDLEPENGRHVFIQSPSGSLQEVREIFHQGVKPVYRVTLRNEEPRTKNQEPARTARFTKDHIFVVKLDDRATAPLNMRLADIIAARAQGRTIYLPVMPA